MSGLKRYTPLRAKKPWRPKVKPMKRTGLARSKPMKKRGKRTSEWEAMRARLKVAYKRAGITTCELGYAGCWHDNGLGFCHSLKRRNIPRGSPLLAETILGCNPCHDRIEKLKHHEMFNLVRSIIAARRVPVNLEK